MISGIVRKLSLSSLALFLFAFSAHAADEPIILPIATEHYPPYEMETPINGLQGFDYEVVVEAFKLLGYKPEVKFWPWKRAVKLAKIGNVVGLLTCAYHKDRAEFIHFSDPISLFTNGFYMRSGFNGPKPDLIEDIIGQKVASIIGYEALKALEDIGAHPMSTPDVENAIRILDKGRIDYLYLGREATDFMIKTVPHESEFEFHPIIKKEFHFCFSKQYPNVEEIVKEFNAALFILKKNGTYDKIHSKYR